MGKLPGHLDSTLNAVMTLWDNPCGLTWIQYAETAFPALGKATLQVLDFDACDILRCIFRPESLPVGSKRNPGRRGKTKIPGPAGIPEYLCERFVPKGDLPHRAVTDGVRHMWAIDGVLQRGLFWWMIADVTNEFFINWGTLIQATEKCRKNFGGHAFGAANRGPTLGGGLWRTVSFENKESEGAASWVGNHLIQLEGTSITVGGAVACTINNLSNPNATYQARLLVDGIPISTSDVSPTGNEDPNLGFVFKPTHTSGGQVSMELKVNGGILEGMTLENAWMYATTDDFKPWKFPNLNSFLCGVPGMLSGN